MVDVELGVLSTGTRRRILGGRLRWRLLFFVGSFWPRCQLRAEEGVGGGEIGVTPSEFCEPMDLTAPKDLTVLA